MSRWLFAYPYPPVFLVAIATAAASYLMLTKDFFSPNATNVNIYMATLGGMFAFMSGFIILLVLSNYRDIRRNMGHEVNALQDIRDFLVYVGPDTATADAINARIKGYVRSVLDEEWPRMVQGTAVETDTSAPLYALMCSVNEIEVTSHRDAVALEQIITEIADVTNYRTDRLGSACKQLPRVLRHFLLLLTAVLVASICMIPFEDVILGSVLNGALSFVVSFIVAVILDLDTPFAGEWSIEPTPYRELLNKEVSRGVEAGRSAGVAGAGQGHLSPSTGAPTSLG